MSDITIASHLSRLYLRVPLQGENRVVVIATWDEKEITDAERDFIEQVRQLARTML